MSDSIVIARPKGQAEQLMLLFHGFGATPHDLVPLGTQLRAAFPKACIVSIGASLPSLSGQGRQWFPLAGVTEENRPQRVADAMPGFIEAVRHWQSETGVGDNATALVGFSQGAIMALESTRHRPAIAGRVIAVAGRFAELPAEANPETTIHLFHGKHDPVMPYAHAVQAAEHLIAIGGDVTADVVPFVGHEISDDIVALILERLRGYVPRRVWDEATRAAATLAPRAASED